MHLEELAMNNTKVRMVQLQDLPRLPLAVYRPIATCHGYPHQLFQGSVMVVLESFT